MSNLIVANNYAYPTPQEFSMIKEMARMAVHSGLLPVSIKTPEQATIIMLKGRELGIPPMVAFAHISVVNGKPCISAELMLSQIYRNNPNAIINFIQNDDKACVIEAKRNKSSKSTWSFTIEDAKNAGLLGKTVWKQYPAAMLRARSISAMARAMFPDALNGVSYTPEELGAEVEIDDNGTEQIKDVIETKVEVKEEPVPLDPPMVLPPRSTDKLGKKVITPMGVIFGHLKGYNLSDDEMRLVLKHVFLVESFKHLTQDHLFQYWEIVNAGRSLWDEYNLLVNIKEPIVENSNSAVDESKVTTQHSTFDESTVESNQIKPAQAIINEQTKLGELINNKSSGQEIPKEELNPVKPRNMAKGEILVPETFPSLLKYGKIKLIPRTTIDNFLKKAEKWPESEELSFLVNAMKEYHGI